MSTNFVPAMSTDEIGVGTSSVCLTDYLEDIETDVSGRAAANHTHSDLVSAIEGLEEAVSALQDSGGSATVTPMLLASMHLGKLDNNSGSENTSSTRICSDPFAIEPNKSYWQVNDKAVNMYVLIYDADELFLEYMGSFASGAEIAVTNSNAAYMRLGSLLGEYDLTNEFRIYDVDPESGGSAAETVDAYSKEEADSRFAAAEHTHTGFAASSHTHTADDITGLPSSVDAYSKTESDERFATANHTHSGYAAENHTHDGYATTNHSHTEYAASGHTHTPASIGAAAASHSHSGYASSGHSHTAAEVGAVPATGGTVNGNLTVTPYLYTAQIMPKDSGSYSIGSSDNRYYSTYLRVNPNVSSDKRRKRDISTIDTAALAAFVAALPVVSYNYNDDAPDEEKRIGLIAQDVISANPEIARFFVEQDKNGFYSLRPADFVFPLIAAVQELFARVANLEGEK